MLMQLDDNIKFTDHFIQTLCRNRFWCGQNTTALYNISIKH